MLIIKTITYKYFSSLYVSLVSLCIVNMFHRQASSDSFDSSQTCSLLFNMIISTFLVAHISLCIVKNIDYFFRA